MGAHVAIELPKSKFAFCDLALDSALQLEAARFGREWNAGPVLALANVLLRTTRPCESEAPAAFIEAGYYEPFERLVRKQEGSAQSIEAIRAYFTAAAESLKADDLATLSNEVLTKLVKFCVSLHQELARELKMEDALSARQWPTSDLQI